MSAQNDFLNTSDPNVIIRKAGTADIPLIAKLSQEIWPECYGQMLGEAQVKYMLELLYSPDALQNDFERGMWYFIALKNEQPVGYLGMIPEMEKMFLSRLYLKSSARGTGIGRTLLDLAQSEAAKHGSTSIYLTVNRGNDKAIAVYRKNGYQITKEICKYIGGGFSMDDYIMEKPIQSSSEQ